MMVWSEGRRPTSVASSQATAALARTPAPRPTFVGEAACAGCHSREAAAWTRLPPSARDATGERGHGARRLRRREARVRRRHVALLSAGPTSLGAHGWPGWRASRLPDHAHLRRRAAAAVPGRASRRAPPGARDSVGQPAGRRGWPALVPSASRRGDHQPGSVALDGRHRELELHVRRLPLHERAQALRRADARHTRPASRRCRSLARPATDPDRATSTGRAGPPPSGAPATRGWRSRSTSARPFHGRTIPPPANRTGASHDNPSARSTCARAAMRAAA